ncbi:hypothetical protein FH966_02690 [Lentibacillus cibarius]|uniref:Uncharacterized protein n=1 Tax=Lentibacillus cibarius TaxID=2583219 RepID=A0A549YFP5_9BACI|nr:hypothetical protein [Lentibacillus cibarius]TRM10709.1 hypothetical protein FH966_02690 [Lentibacillus cibarius]
MIDYKSIPSSTAQQLNDATLFDDEFVFTYTGSIDEKKLYDDINKRLTGLETSLDRNKEELEAINHMTADFCVANDEKEEVLLRVGWLRRLYQVKEEIETVDTKQKTKSLRRLLSPVQTCPMKNQLMTKMDELEQSLPEEDDISSEPSNEQQLMEKAIEEAGDVFINLGKTGRDFVIAGVLEQFRGNANVDTVKESAIAIEQRVKALSDVNDQNEVIASLEQLPLKSFAGLKTDRKVVIANRLIESNKWNGLAAMDRQIAQLDRAITKEEKEKEEAENTVLTEDGKAALTLNINDNADNNSKFIMLD